jgi:hypothetical protein
MDLLRIDNDGPRILACNFWGSEVERAGKLYVSLNAGAFRLLVPAAVQSFPRRMNPSPAPPSRGLGLSFSAPGRRAQGFSVRGRAPPCPHALV